MNIDTIIQELNNSIMFNLSLSSKELFHSNFLSFLFSKYNDLLCKIIDEDNFKFEIKREHKHIDLEIIGRDGNNYIIENKIKDILQQEQYDEITQLYIRDKYKGVILFSLLGNNLSMLDEKYKWKEIGYKEIINSLMNYDFNDKYLSSIVHDYCCFVNNIIELLNIEIKRYIFHYDNEILKKLTTIRIHDLFLKYGMSLFVNYFKNYIKGQNNIDIFIEYGINRSMGTMSFYRVVNSVSIGIQIENLQYRKFSICDIKTRTELEQKRWFDKDYRSSRNKHYLEYSDKDVTKKFYYQLQNNNIKDIEFYKLSQIIYKDLSDI